MRFRPPRKVTSQKLTYPKDIFWRIFYWKEWGVLGDVHDNILNECKAYLKDGEAVAGEERCALIP